MDSPLNMDAGRIRPAHTQVALFFLVAAIWLPQVVRSQPRAAGGWGEPAWAGPAALDRRVLLSVYRIEKPVFRAYMFGVDATAYPVFFGGLPLIWGGAVLFGRRQARQDAYLLTVAEAVAIGGAIGLKRLFRRPRPYTVFPEIRSRSRTMRPSAEADDPYAFPSGHTTVAFALAVSWSLAYPAWYVTAPALIWASSVALSRVWLGVHYPSDVLAGILLGAAIAAVVHRAGPSITPGFLRAKGDPMPVPVLHIRLLRR